MSLQGGGSKNRMSEREEDPRQWIHPLEEKSNLKGRSEVGRNRD